MESRKLLCQPWFFRLLWFFLIFFIWVSSKPGDWVQLCLMRYNITEMTTNQLAVQPFICLVHSQMLTMSHSFHASFAIKFTLKPSTLATQEVPPNQTTHDFLIEHMRFFSLTPPIYKSCPNWVLPFSQFDRFITMNPWLSKDEWFTVLKWRIQSTTSWIFFRWDHISYHRKPQMSDGHSVCGSKTNKFKQKEVYIGLTQNCLNR